MACFPEFCPQQGYFRSPECLQVKGNCEKSTCNQSEAPVFQILGFKKAGLQTSTFQEFIQVNSQSLGELLLLFLEFWKETVIRLYPNCLRNL